MSSALLDTPLEALQDEVGPAPHAAPHIALRHEVAERLAAHRSRRSRLHVQDPQSPIQEAATAAPPTSRVSSAASAAASAVAKRYANAPSFRAVLAEQAERAIRDAAAAAEVAALNARAVESAQLQLLAELDLWAQEPSPPAHKAAPRSTPSPAPLSSCGQAAALDASPLQGGLTIRLFEPLAEPGIAARSQPAKASALPAQDREALALDEEIAFRQAPVFEEPAGPAIALPANLIEFPRQLVASRKARPRHAEGPLREDDRHDHSRDDEQDPHSGQLRIFEVEDLSSPLLEPHASAERAALWLDTAHPSPEVSPADSDLPAQAVPSAPRPQAASIGDRLLALTVDGCLVMAGLIIATSAFALTAGQAFDPRFALATAAASAIVALTLFYLLYQMLFFTLACATPGMRYARIALCTLTDTNPTRRQMQRRVAGSLMVPASIGSACLWAFVDKDRLGWHDRLTGTYQRSY